MRAVALLVSFAFLAAPGAYAAPLRKPAAPDASPGSSQWNRFRGPNGSGVGAEADPPVPIAKDSAVWRTPLPPGKSSPILWKGRIFLTAVENERLLTLGIDTRKGVILWRREAPAVPLERVHEANSPASSTPAADAERVYVYFGSFGLLAYSHDGKELWKKRIPTPKSLYGVSTSPILYDDSVILVLDDDANLPGSALSRSRIAAFDKKTGALKWETPRPLQRSSWSTPILWRHEYGVDLVVHGNGRACAYDPATGEEKWFASGFSREVIAVPVAGAGRVYISASRRGGWGDAEVDPEPFWKAALHFDRNADGRIGRDEVGGDFTLPFRPELPPGHPGFGFPLPKDPARRRQRQLALFDWRDTNKDGFWTKEEFVAEMRLSPVKPNLAAIRPGGRGDVTRTHVDWNLRRGIPEIPSPVFYKGRLYLIRDGGILTCVRAEDGAIVYQARTGAPGQYVASPVVAAGRLYLVSQRGVVTVVKTGDTFEILHQGALEELVSATPAVAGDSLYIRTETALFAFR